uniref:Receptor ligand binding region domain-containing protein n=1 Tax=Branchiostoma floridae TaxID=7739 RepID=C3YS67_BRAFL|eukprot:XP_002600960.1 hypothetical protein BRAFLDRAFT_79158 [Branchiostoma floridae]
MLSSVVQRHHKMRHVVLYLAIIIHTATLPKPSTATATSQVSVGICGPSDIIEDVELDMDGQDRRTVYIGGLFALSGSSYASKGFSELAAARLAIKHVNEAKMIPGIKLKMFCNNTQVSYASTSPALSDRKLFPTFFRTEAPDSSHNAARRAFIQYFDWQNVAVLYQDQEMFSFVREEMF